MDNKKVLAALEAAQVALNTTTDAVVKAKEFKALPRIESAAKAIELAISHVVGAQKRVTPKPADSTAAANA